MLYRLEYLSLKKISLDELKLYREELILDIKKRNNEKLRVDRAIKLAQQALKGGE